MTTPTSTEQYLTRGGVTVRHTMERASPSTMPSMRYSKGSTPRGASCVELRVPAATRGGISVSSTRPSCSPRGGAASGSAAFNERGRVSRPRSAGRCRGSTRGGDRRRGRTTSRARCRRPPGASTRGTGAVNPRCSPVVRALVELFFPEDEPTWACTARSATTSRFSSSRSACAERPPDQRDLVLYLPDELSSSTIGASSPSGGATTSRSTATHRGLPRDGAACP